MKPTRRSFLLTSAVCGIAQAQAPPAQPAANTTKMDIFQAAAAGDVPRVTELADADPQVVRLRSPDGRTPLHFATAAGKSAAAFFLLSRGAELSAGPESPLLAAVDYPDADPASAMAQSLLVNASDPNARRKDGKSALNLAAARGYGDICELLIHRGATVTRTDVAVATGDAARLLGNVSAVERVHYDRRYLQDIQKKRVARDDTNGLAWTLVNQFVTVGHFDFEKVKSLYQANPELLNTRASWDEIAIEAASHTGHVAIAQWLAEKGAPVSTCTAALLGLGGHVKEAIAADPLSVHERGAHDIAILAYTAYGTEQPRIAETLLKAGASVNGRAFGLTTLHIAASKGYTELASILIDNGTDVNMAVKTRGEMMTPLAVAIKEKQAKMEEFLKGRGGRI